ncbi:MAG: accessory factor UbiK family protein [Parvibaculaceae bacterium]
MTTTSSRFFDELAKLATNAAGAAQGVRREIDTLVKAQVERVLNDVGVVKREDFDVVREMAQKAREENERLHERLAVLEARLGVTPSPSRQQSESPADPATH